jgi:hypothetical protein
MRGPFQNTKLRILYKTTAWQLCENPTLSSSTLDMPLTMHAKNHLHTVIERFLCDCFKCSSESVELVDARQSCPQFSKNWVASLDCCLLFTVAFKGFLLVILTAKDWWISPINHLCKVQWLQQHDHPMIKSCDGSHVWWIVHLILFHIQLKWSKNLMKQSWSSAKRKWCIICDECLIGAILIYRQTQEALGQFSDMKCTRNSIHSTSKAQIKCIHSHTVIFE